MSLVHPFSFDFLIEELTLSPPLKEEISQKEHIKYLRKYFNQTDFKIKTIVREEVYVSKDYLYDYKEYYSTIFEEYERFCKRIHLFSNEFSEEDFDRIILSGFDNNKDFWKHYLGFIVIKKLPIYNIGFTLLKHYGPPRDFWGARKYIVHIYGNEIPIDSLAFQEQDKVVSACATTAIWCMLQKASKADYATLKPPSDLTKDAGLLSPGGGRLFPNKGLNLLQMCQVIFKSGLDTEVRKPNLRIRLSPKKYLDVISIEYIKKLVYAYSPIGIPIILIIRIPVDDEPLHAVTVCGHNVGAIDKGFPKKSFNWYSDNVDKIYAHDDQFGPFVKILFKGDTELITPWNDKYPNEEIYAKNIIIPVYKKIRITYDDIEKMVIRLHETLLKCFKSTFYKFFQFEIRVNYSEQYKSSIRTLDPLDESIKFEIIKQSMPKYIWIVTFYVISYKLFEFTFDATNIESGIIGITRLCFDIKNKSTYNTIIGNNAGIYSVLERHFQEYKHQHPFFK